MRIPVKVPVRQLRALRHRIGRRGLFLGFLAVLDGVFGYFLLIPPVGFSPTQVFPLLPETAWAVAWLTVGASCIVGMFMKVDRVPYMLAALLKASWGLRYAYIWYKGLAPYAWVSLVIWLAFAGTVMMVAGWPEAKVIVLPPEAKR